MASAAAPPAPPVLDDIDRGIVAALVDDGRMSVNELAGQVGVSRATAYARLDRLRSEGVITGFTATVDPAKLGHGVAALILVNVEQNEWRAARDELLHLPGVEYLAFTSGGFDMVALVRVPSIEALRDVVLDHLHGATHVRSTQTVFVLDEQRPDFPVPRLVHGDRARGGRVGQ
jgi:Lrp/AsnC family transcriptional regulator, leucine-responsive regulatory protein